MAHVDDEIASQPACWQRASELARTAAMALPRRGHRVAAVGCGTSWFIAQAYAALREAAGHGETDAYAASQFPTGRHYDRIVAITRSGTTTEVLDLIRALPDHVPITALTADPGSPVNGLASDPIAMPFADERSVVQTRFATTALALLRAHLELPVPVEEATDAVAAPLPLDPAKIEQVTFLGDGWTVGIAHEAALKCREAARLWTESYPAMEYRHGPISIAGPDRAVWLFSHPPAGLTDQIAGTRATIVHSGREPLAELIVAQRFAAAVAAHRGLDPDNPLHLTRSVVLP